MMARRKPETVAAEDVDGEVAVRLTKQVKIDGKYIKAGTVIKSPTQDVYDRLEATESMKPLDDADAEEVVDLSEGSDVDGDGLGGE